MSWVFVVLFFIPKSLIDSILFDLRQHRHRLRCEICSHVPDMRCIRYVSTCLICPFVWIAAVVQQTALSQQGGEHRQDFKAMLRLVLRKIFFKKKKKSSLRGDGWLWRTIPWTVLTRAGFLCCLTQAAHNKLWQGSVMKGCIKCPNSDTILQEGLTRVTSGRAFAFGSGQTQIIRNTYSYW